MDETAAGRATARGSLPAVASRPARTPSVRLEELPLPAKQRELLEKMLRGYQRQDHAQRFGDEAVARKRRAVLSFTAHCGKGPWEWDREDFKAWSAHLHRGLGRSLGHHRKMLGDVVAFLTYLHDSERFQVEAAPFVRRGRHETGPAIRLSITRRDCIPHRDEREAEAPARGFTEEEIERIFSTVQDEIHAAGESRTKDYLPLLRDRVLFFTMYAMGLRASEALSLDVDSFLPNYECGREEFSRFGSAQVIGKGHRGNRRIPRVVPIVHPCVPGMLETYIGLVRPRFLGKAKDPNEKALFLSERGKRLSRSALQDRFKRLMGTSGVAPKKPTTHWMRHTFANSVAQMAPLLAVQRALGHKRIDTTLIYLRNIDEFVRENFNRIIELQIESARR